MEYKSPCVGKQSLEFRRDVFIQESASIVGQKEGEGPFSFRPYKNKNLWYLFADCHDANAEKIFGAWSSTDLIHWKGEDAHTEFPQGVIRHCSTVSVTLEEAVKLINMKSN